MELQIKHDGGFFSCCSVRLHFLVEFFNKYKELPLILNSKGFYNMYKSNENDDITFDYFVHYDQIPITIEYTDEVKFHETYQYKNYEELNMGVLLPFIEKYFTPSDLVQGTSKLIENKYKIDYENMCVLFYRGNDKESEVKLPKYEDYLKYADYLYNENPNLKFLIQSDETNFLKFMVNKYPNNSIIFLDEIRHINKMNTSVDKIKPEENYNYSIKYMAITLIMSKCKYVICNTGNCSLWIMFFRKSFNNMIQLR